MTRRSMALILVVILLCTLLCSCKRATEWEEIPVEGTVAEMHHRDSYVTFSVISNGKTTITVPRNHPAEYKVTITYEAIEQIFDNKELFEKVSIGDKVELILINGYTADHELVTQKLQLK